MHMANTRDGDDLREFGRRVLTQEVEGIQYLAGLLDESFDAAVQAILDCSGHIIISGVGKPWLIGQKISATMASTGTPSFALHPSEAVHGDIGRLREQDLVIAMSNSGTSEEVIRLIPIVKRVGCRIIAVTAGLDSPLGEAADVVLNMGKTNEACPIGMAPSVSTTVMLALGDALALTVMKARNFGREDYARFHPGGALGRSMMRVSEVMQPLAGTAHVQASASVADALNAITLHKSGAAFVTENDCLVGVFTDGDLRRHIEDDNLLSQPVGEVMTAGGHRVSPDDLVTEAVRVIEEFRIGELPVVNSQQELTGQVVLKDLVSMHFV
jgi:arabinose-5-phosphate isomerase